MVSSADVIAAARSWIGTPYRDKGRRKGKGADCIGLLVGVAHELGLSDWDIRAYTRHPRPEILLRHCDEQLVKTGRFRNDLRLADIIVARERSVITHLGIIADGDNPFSLIHASFELGFCGEHRLDEATRHKICRVYRFPGVSDE